MTKEEAWDAMCAAFIKERCGDSICIFGRNTPAGMMTNGGCRTLKDKADIQKSLMRLATEWRHLCDLVEGRTRDAYTCYYVNPDKYGDMGDGCSEAKWIGGEWGRPVCHNPLHHKKG